MLLIGFAVHLLIGDKPSLIRGAAPLRNMLAAYRYLQAVFGSGRAGICEGSGGKGGA